MCLYFQFSGLSPEIDLVISKSDRKSRKQRPKISEVLAARPRNIRKSESWARTETSVLIPKLFDQNNLFYYWERFWSQIKSWLKAGQCFVPIYQWYIPLYVLWTPIFTNIWCCHCCCATTLAQFHRFWLRSCFCLKRKKSQIMKVCQSQKRSHVRPKFNSF